MPDNRRLLETVQTIDGQTFHRWGTPDEPGGLVDRRLTIDPSVSIPKECIVTGTGVIGPETVLRFGAVSQYVRVFHDPAGGTTIRQPQV
jgi:hypothetical protein